MRTPKKSLNIPPAETNAPLRDLTTYKIGGPAKTLYRPRQQEEVQNLVVYLHKTNQKFHIIGGGSNLLISDKGLSSPVILMTECGDEIESEGGWIKCGAGVALQNLVKYTLQRSFTGMERLAGIPGTVGGALCMNAGAYGGEISQYLISVEVIDEIGQVCGLSKEDIRFAYRSAPGLRGKIVLSAEFNFVDRSPMAAGKIAEKILKLRSDRQPLNYPSAGSVFKKHPLGPAGKFIEMAGLKRTIIGGAQISPKHANFIVNLGDAQAMEVLALMRLAQRTVFEKYNIELELEQKLLGFSEEELFSPEKFL